MAMPRLVTRSAILAGYALGAGALYWRLPAEIPPSWTGPSGDVTWLGASLVAFLLPTATAVIESLLRGLFQRHPIDQHNAANALLVFDAILARVAVFVLGVHAAVLAGLLGLFFRQEWAARASLAHGKLSAIWDSIPQEWMCDEFGDPRPVIARAEVESILRQPDEYPDDFWKILLPQ